MITEWWIERGALMTWAGQGRIQSRVITGDAVDGDLHARKGEWLVVRADGRVELLEARLAIPVRTFSRRGIRARWIGDLVQVQENDGRTRIYDYSGFLQRVV